MAREPTADDLQAFSVKREIGRPDRTRACIVGQSGHSVRIQRSMKVLPKP
jgi:hypothetical protein